MLDGLSVVKYVERETNNLNSFPEFDDSCARYDVFKIEKYQDIDWKCYRTNHEKDSEEHRILEQVKDACTDQHECDRLKLIYTFIYI